MIPNQHLSFVYGFFICFSNAQSLWESSVGGGGGGGLSESINASAFYVVKTFVSETSLLRTYFTGFLPLDMCALHDYVFSVAAVHLWSLFSNSEFFLP